MIYTASAIMTVLKQQAGSVKPPVALVKTSDASKHLLREPRMSKWWILEAFALLVSTSSLLSLTAVLTIFNGRAASDWNGPVSLNAVVSILATVARSSLIFPLTNGISQWKWMSLRMHEQPLISLQHYDEASRGVWGAVKLLVRPSYASFASLGALVVAVAAAFEPFAQQGVSYPSRDVVVGQAFLPRSSYYNTPFSASSRYNAALKIAIYDNIVGLGTPAVDSTIRADCPTANCHWDEYTSVGVCSQCVDITSRLRMDYPNNTEEENSCREHGVMSNCPYDVTTPNDQVSVRWDGGVATAVINVTSFDQSAYLLNGYTYTSMANISMVAMMSPTDFVSYDCVLYGCAKKYTASVTNGHLTEKVVKTYWNQTLPQFPFVPSAHIPGLSANLTTVVLGHDLMSRQDELISFDYDALSVVSTNLQNNFGSNQNERALGNIQEDGTFAYDPAQGATSDQVLALWENGARNFPESIAQVAEGLTNYMRLASPSELAVGAATGSQPYIHVRWEWLALPFGLELLTYIFILGTVVISKSSDIPRWRASSLVPWFHGPGTGAESGTTKTNLEMESLARQTKVQFMGARTNLSLTQKSTVATAADGKATVESLGRRVLREVEEIPATILG